MDVFRLRLRRLSLSWPFLRLRKPIAGSQRLRIPFCCSSTLAFVQALNHQVQNEASPSLVVLRDYQEECIQSVLRYLDQGHKRLGISLATGSGKTVIFTQLISRIPTRNGYGDKTLIIVHRRELVEQAAEHCRVAYPNLKVEIEMGNRVSAGQGDIIIASIQSLISKDRLHKFAPDVFKLILVDEAHHIVAQSYGMVLDHFGLGGQSDDSPVLVGVSATLSRPDGLKLGAAIDHIVYHKDYMDMINSKWLADAIFTTVKSQANLSAVRTDKFGDFAVASLSKAVNTGMTNTITVRAWLDCARERKSTLVFCVDINHVINLTQAYRNAGIDARYLTAKTPAHVREKQLLAFKNQEFPVLLNCGLFTEGTDIPNIDCVLLARPTRSKNLLIQMIGRGLRLYPGKENCHIIDMVASLGVGVLSTPTLFGLDPDTVLHKANSSELEKHRDDTSCKLQDSQSNDSLLLEDDVSVAFTKYDSIHDLMRVANLERHVRSISRNAWVRIGPDRYTISQSSGWITIDKVSAVGVGDSDMSDSKLHSNPNEMYEVRHVRKFKAARGLVEGYTRPKLIMSSPDFETAVHAADTYADSIFLPVFIRSKMGWRRAKATAGQLKILNGSHAKNKPLYTSDITRGEAADMITRLKSGGIRWLKSMDKQASKNTKVLELRKGEEVRVGPVE